MSRILPWALAAAVWLEGVGCGGDDPPIDNPEDPRVLEVLEPPGDSIGLTFTETIVLQVRYLTADGLAIADEPVQFTILAGGSEVVGGAALSANESLTDSEGIATVELVGGAVSAGFRVSATAERAPPATFFIAITDQGFTRLVVEPVHQGPRSEPAFTSVEVRLYRTSELVCADADPDELPESVLPVRSLERFGDLAEFPNLASGGAFTVVVLGHIAPSGTPLAFGCLQLDGSQTRNFDVNAPVVAADRSVAMADALELVSVIDLEQAQSTAAEAPWAILGCPLGSGQLALDCIADALVPDGTLDCDFTGTSAVASAIRNERGAPDGSGCYPATKAAGGDSLDKLVDDAITAGGTFPTGSDLADLVAIRANIASAITLRSTLWVIGSTSEHRLISAEVGPAPAFSVDLVASARPVIAQTAIATSVGPEGSPAPLAVIEEHSFTLETGTVAAAGFAALALEPLSLDPAALGTALMASASEGLNTGCDALSSVICSAAGEIDACAASACATAAGYLDDELRAWWQHLDQPGLDLDLHGEITLRDTDGDLVVNVLGRDATGAITGSWTATVDTGDGPIETTATAASPVP